MSAFNGTTEAVCAFLSLDTVRFNSSWAPSDLVDSLRIAWDINATWAESTLINPPVRQYQMAMCFERLQLSVQVGKQIG